MPLLKVDLEQLQELIEQLSPQERLEILLKLAQPAQARMEAHRAYAKQQLRELVARQGLDWDTLQEAEREAFVDDFLHVSMPTETDSG